MPEAPSSTPHPADALRARHSLCVGCGYHFDGIPILDGSIRCPECGHLNAYELRPPAPRRARGLAIGTGIGVFVAAIGIPLALMLESTTLVVLLLALAVAALWVVPRLMRRAFDL